MKHFYTKDMTFTEDAEYLNELIIDSVWPIVKRYIEKGYSEPEILLFLHDTITFKLADYRRNKLKIKRK